MGLTTGSGRGARSAINVTPLIDVLLVLLIIFMVIQPSNQHGLGALAPQPPATDQAESDPHTLVVTVDNGPTGPSYALNGQALELAALGPALQRIGSQGASRPIFVRGDAALPYAAVTPVIDLAHAAGLDQVGIVTPATPLR